MSAEQIFNLLLHYFSAYGYWLIFFGTLLENTIFIGLFVTGDVLLLAASFLASQNKFSLILVIVIGSLGGILGNNIGYFIGYKGGRSFVEKYGRYFFISKKRIKASEDYFDTHGNKTVFIGRFATGIKAFVAVMAGAAHMNYGRFFVYTGAATILWTTFVCLVGFFFGQNWQYVMRLVAQAGWLILTVIIIFVILGLFYRYYFGRESTD